MQRAAADLPSPAAELHEEGQQTHGHPWGARGLGHRHPACWFEGLQLGGVQREADFGWCFTWLELIRP